MLACALAMKILVPAGFMPVVSGGRVTIEICGGITPAQTVMVPMRAMTMPMTMPGMAHHSDKSDHQEREMPCAFSGLTAPSLAAVDPVLLAIAIAFIVGLVFRVRTAVSIAAQPYLRPPLRGPPPLPAA
ncbi:hypothetical protein C8J25_102246 [Sphingomonas faeni]|uniref:DUF2946 family protein n=1 Tax=Sphingomonas faeni TaxID=185950 RepID=A0A2T5U9H3_9SPHN|nr:hypothetical protein C8J25_102246 [Sphingomonas faeni]